MFFLFLSQVSSKIQIHVGFLFTSRPYFLKTCNNLPFKDITPIYESMRYFKVKCDAKIKWCSIIEILTNLEKASSHYLTFISNRPWVLREEGVHSLALFKVELIVWAHFFHRLIICPNCQMYFFKLYSVFVQIVKFYFFKFPKLFV